MSHQSSRLILSKLERAIEAREFDRAVEIIHALETDRALSPRELVLKARCLQLGTGREGDELPRAEAALKAALAIDSEYVPALVELGWFRFAVSDDASGARELFEKGFELAARNCTEALTGLFNAVEELDSKSAARAMVLDRAQKAIDVAAIAAK